MKIVVVCLLLAAALLSADAANLRAVRRLHVRADAMQTPASCGSACANCIIENNFQAFSSIRLDCTNRDSSVATFCTDPKNTATCDTLRAGVCATACPAIPPVITSIAPNSGAVAGNVPITVRGSGFISTSEVRFGNNKCAVTSSQPTSIICTLPTVSTAGSVTVTVANGNLVSNEMSFTYTAPPPPTSTGTGTAPPTPTATGTGPAAPPSATGTGGNPPSSTGPAVPPGCTLGTARGPLGKLPTCPEPPKRYVTAVIDECPRQTRCCQSGGYVRIDNVVQPGVVPRGTLIPSCHQ